MKVALFISMMFVVSSAFASLVECENRVSATRTENTYIRNDSLLLIGREYKTCVKTGGIDSCSKSEVEVVVDENSLCSQHLNVAKDCLVSESSTRGAYSISVQCISGLNLSLRVKSNQTAKLTCIENHHIVSEWDLGTCEVK